jgi:hypothetical protein
MLEVIFCSQEETKIPITMLVEVQEWQYSTSGFTKLCNTLASFVKEKDGVIRIEEIDDCFLFCSINRYKQYCHTIL